MLDVLLQEGWLTREPARLRQRAGACLLCSMQISTLQKAYEKGTWN